MKNVGEREIYFLMSKLQKKAILVIIFGEILSFLIEFLAEKIYRKLLRESFMF